MFELVLSLAEGLVWCSSLVTEDLVKKFLKISSNMKSWISLHLAGEWFWVMSIGAVLVREACRR